jgi:hypothetical protein
MKVGIKMTQKYHSQSALKRCTEEHKETFEKKINVALATIERK